jgi:hypothetical protein
MDEGIRTAFLGLMPPRKFLSEFFPRDASEAVSSAFKPGLFDELDELVTRGGRMEKMMYGPFVHTILPYFVAKS